MSYNMTGEEYELLYKRYLTRSPKELLEMAGMKRGMSVLDLCCGSNGRASKAALKMGASYVCAVDENPCASKLKIYEKLDVFCGDLYYFFNYVTLEYPFDIVICQQGVNYWLTINDSGIIDKIDDIIKPNGKFIFNTFNDCPSEKVTVKEYEIDGLKYSEVFNYYKAESLICHLQSADGLRPHYTEFSWIPPEIFKEKLNMFDIEVKTDGNTDIYICTKKD